MRGGSSPKRQLGAEHCVNEPLRLPLSSLRPRGPVMALDSEDLNSHLEPCHPVFVDIEYSNLDIDVTVFDIVVTKKTSISTKRRYRRLELRYRVLKLKHFYIVVDVVWVLRYQYRCYSISKSHYCILDPISKTADIVVLQRRYRRFCN